MSTPATNPADLRVDYMRAALDESDVDLDPFRQFARGFDEAVAVEVTEPNAMTLATVDSAGGPSARVVLLKAVDGRGLTFCLSRIGTWASPQSEPLPDRAALEARFAQADARYPDESVPRPPHWGGYGLVPEALEFWQGRASRLHDHLIYQRDSRSEDAGWRIGRLAP